MLTSILLLSFITVSDIPVSCGQAVHPDTVKAIIEVESAGNPLAIHDNTTDLSYSPHSLEVAKNIASALIAKGHSIDIGLMQINSQNIRRYKLDQEKLFEPCYNIRTGTTILAGCYQENNRVNQSPEITLLKALSCFNTGRSYSGKKYINKILRAAGSSAKIPIRETKNEKSIYGKSISFYTHE